MSTWRDGVDQQIQDDFDQLYGVVRDVALRNITSSGSTIPFAVNIERDGGVRLAAAQPRSGASNLATDALDLPLEGAVDQRDANRATAIACDVSVDGSNAVRLELEHSLGGPALELLLPYTRDDSSGEVSGLTLQVSVADLRRIWG